MVDLDGVSATEMLKSADSLDMVVFQEEGRKISYF